MLPVGPTRPDVRVGVRTVGKFVTVGAVKISARTDYAIRAMLSLADAATPTLRQAPVTPLSVDVVCRSQDLPRKFVEAIFSDLRRAGLITSTRGARGGYTLARPAAEISLGDIYRAVDGPLAEVRGLRPQDLKYEGVAVNLPLVWIAVRSALRRVLDEVTLADASTGDLPAHVEELLTEPDAWLNR